jgi:acetyl-CoA carboxylase biotin carboxyl carrier protein
LVDIKEIEDLIELMRRSGLSELSVESGDFKISIKRALEGAVGEGTPAAGGEAVSSVTQAGNLRTPNATEAAAVSVISPVVGVFHNGGMEEPREPVRAGDRVQEGQVLAAIEAMKVPHEVRAAVGGMVTEVLVSDGAAVAYGQKLFLIQPEEETSEVESSLGLA